MYQHFDDIVKSNDPDLPNKGQTALVRHFQDGHAPNFEKVSILSMEPIEFKRRILEALHILSNDTVNFRQDIDNIDVTYQSLFS